MSYTILRVPNPADLLHDLSTQHRSLYIHHILHCLLRLKKSVQQIKSFNSSPLNKICPCDVYVMAAIPTYNLHYMAHRETEEYGNEIELQQEQPAIITTTTCRCHQVFFTMPLNFTFIVMCSVPIRTTLCDACVCTFVRRCTIEIILSAPPSAYPFGCVGRAYSHIF